MINLEYFKAYNISVSRWIKELQVTHVKVLAQKYVQAYKRVEFHILKTIDLHIVCTYIGDSINNYIFANLPVFFIGSRETSKTLKT